MSVKKNPKVTVIMPVYNGEKYLQEAIDSILNQTFTDFEFLIINDGSTDDSQKIISNYKDKRIKLIKNKQNIGLARSLNKAIELSLGLYIARMDADDISLPNRLKVQVSEMEKNSNLGVIGSWVEIFENAKNGNIWKYPESNNQISSQLLLHCCFAHPTVLINKRLINQYNYRYPEIRYGEDYAFWLKMNKNLEYKNIQQVLLKYRITKSSLSRGNKDAYSQSVRNIQKEYLKSMKVEASPAELIIHNMLGLSEFRKLLLHETEAWIAKLISSEEINNNFYTMDLLKKQWKKSLKWSIVASPKAMYLFLFSKLHKRLNISVLARLKYLLNKFLPKKNR